MIINVHCSSLQDFSSYIESVLYPEKGFVRGQYVFRGQSNSKWGLESSLDRMLSDSEIPKRMDICDKLLKRFQDLINDENISNEKYLGYTKENYLALGQHYGLPTPLLDWTESPYIALFFAFSGFSKELSEEIDGDVAIWGLRASSEFLGENMGCKLLSMPKGNDVRIRNQEGVFTVLTAPRRTLNEYADDASKYCDKDNVNLVKISFPKKIRNNVLRSLDAMGISEMRIYPGLEGIARRAVRLTTC